MREVVRRRAADVTTSWSRFCDGTSRMARPRERELSKSCPPLRPPFGPPSAVGQVGRWQVNTIQRVAQPHHVGVEKEGTFGARERLVQQVPLEPDRVLVVGLPGI